MSRRSSANPNPDPNPNPNPNPNPIPNPIPNPDQVKGWRDTPIFARSDWWQKQSHPMTLPQPVCELIDVIEHFTGTQVISIGNGPRGDEIIYIKRKEGPSPHPSPSPHPNPDPNPNPNPNPNLNPSPNPNPSPNRNPGPNPTQEGGKRKDGRAKGK